MPVETFFSKDACMSTGTLGFRYILRGHENLSARKLGGAKVSVQAFQCTGFKGAGQKMMCTIY